MHLLGQTEAKAVSHSALSRKWPRILVPFHWFYFESNSILGLSDSKKVSKPAE